MLLFLDRYFGVFDSDLRANPPPVCLVMECPPGSLIVELPSIFKPQDMIIIFKFPNGKRYPGRHEKCKLRKTEKCERSHM